MTTQPDGQNAAPVPRGTAAIDLHVDGADGGPEERRFHPKGPKRFSGPAVEDVTVHRIEEPAHWHLVTYGLSELHAKESTDAELSGWGFELTFRLADTDGEIPFWAVDMLSSLAAYVGSSQHPFADGHNVDLRGPIRLGTDSTITAAMMVEDPGLPALAGPYGRVEFLQVVGITADELELCRSWSTEGVRDLLKRDDPLLVTRLDRPSVATDPRWTIEIGERMATEGSSLHELRVASLKCKKRMGRGTVVEMGAGASSALGPALRRELVGAGARFAVIGDEGEVRFVVAPEAGWSGPLDDLEVAVPLDGVEKLALLFDGRVGWGRLEDWPGLRFRVVK